jgi:hypothetical protein
LRSPPAAAQMPSSRRRMTWRASSGAYGMMRPARAPGAWHRQAAPVAIAAEIQED